MAEPAAALPKRRDFLAATAAVSTTTTVGAAHGQNHGGVIDAWGHVSLPRFLSAEEYLSILDANGVEAGHCRDSANLPQICGSFGEPRFSMAIVCV